MADPQRPPPTNPFALLSVVMGALSLPCICVCYGFPFNVLGLAFGGVALYQISQDPEQHGGKPLAIVGMVLGAMSFALVCMGLITALIFGGPGGNSDLEYEIEQMLEELERELG
ncbi:MAG: DUF4190 domain-containing protein [Alphaproteobacteria bacterium]|nr:DUF4190 domain-containing protein [Alphaproteobacteria bacterium]MCB9797471.1 DUF4190 domain-containing protein [Alphaproteobacteria bacterium]